MAPHNRGAIFYFTSGITIIIVCRVAHLDFLFAAQQ